MSISASSRTRASRGPASDADPPPELVEELLRDLADQPRWVEARGMLLAGRCDVLVGPERHHAGYVVVERGRPLACAVDRPVAGVVAELRKRFPDKHEILVPARSSAHLRSMLPGWTARPATLHIHPDPEILPAPQHDVRLLGAEDEAFLEALPPGTAHEISLTLTYAPVAATFVGGAPVAFCGAAYETETWWDLSTYTPPAHRRRRYASSAAAFLIRHMLARGKSPVWGAMDANEASLAMAARYGFRAVDRLVVFTPPEAEPSPE